MAFKAVHSLLIRGVSSTGSKHDLHIEQAEDGWTRFTVVGHNGKRHASVLVDTDYTATEVTDFFKNGHRA
jgi:hypothetical protein